MTSYFFKRTLRTSWTTARKLDLDDWREMVEYLKSRLLYARYME